TFVSVMKKAPKTIITDQDPWMSEAISTEMPTTKHSFCIWHITSKFSCWFAALLCNEYQKWCGDFYMLYKMTSPEEFEQNWSIVIERYNCKVREFWAPSYLRDYFFRGIKNNWKIREYKCIYQEICFFSHISQIDMVVEEISQEHSHKKVVVTLRPISWKSNSPLEKQAFEVLTPFAFKKFQELARCTSYTMMQVDANKFIVRFFEGNTARHHKVFWDGYTALCSCKNFEFWGIICRHILRVFCQRDCFVIPPSYLPPRWHCDILEAISNTMEHDDGLPKDESNSINNTYEGEDNVLCPPKSKTKGRPKKARKGWKRIGNKADYVLFQMQATRSHKTNLSRKGKYIRWIIYIIEKTKKICRRFGTKSCIYSK
ncbi:Protein FAR1-RELATED SEQUENCE 11, partial [Bienertia sinuspersici]